jgi:hypothetical protein
VKRPRGRPALPPPGRRPALLALAAVCALAAGTLPLRAAPAAALSPAAEVTDGPNPRFTGVPFLRVWGAEDYGALPNSRDVVQHPGTGVLWFANGGGLVEYDGERWRRHLVPGGAGVNALAIDATGHVWCATERDLFRVVPGPDGTPAFVSQLPRLPESGAAVFPLGRLIARPEGIYAAGHRHLVRFPLAADGPARLWPLPAGENLPAVWLMADALHVRLPDGVLRLDGDRLVASELRTFAYLTRPDPLGGWQMVSRDGVRRWDDAYRPVAPGSGSTVTPFAGDVALCAAFLPDGRIAFGTARSGVVLADHAGRRLQEISREHGLPSNRIEALATDRDGGLWVTLRNGIVRLQLDSPYARHGLVAPRIDSSPSVLALHRGELYVGGGEGLWQRDRRGTFRAIADLPHLVRQLHEFDAALHATGVELRRIRPDGRAEKIDSATFGLVTPEGMPDHAIRGTPDGIVFNRATDGRWIAGGRIAALAGPTAVLGEWPAGFLWAVNQQAGLCRIDLRGGLTPAAPVRRFRGDRGPLADVTQYNVELFPWGGTLAGAIAGRLLRFDPATDRFVAEDRIAGLAPQGGFIRATPSGARPEPDGSLWLQLRGNASGLVRVVPAGPDRWQVETPTGHPAPRFTALALQSDPARHTLWIATAGGLFSRDLGWRPAADPAPLTVRFRRLEADDNTLLWSDGARSGPTLSLPAARNALRVLFAAPTTLADHLGRTRVEYRTRLVGLDRDWTPWQALARRDFTNLPYRSLTLEVEARDSSGRTSAREAFTLHLAPPAWLTSWAFGLYLLAAGSGIAAFVGWRTRRLRHRAAALEAVVAQRTDELRRSNAELARLHALEHDEKLAARLAEEKARLEALRYQLNPHFLFNTLTSIRGQLPATSTGARRTIERLTDFCELALEPAGDADAAHTLGREVELLGAYLDIERSRWGELLSVRLTCPVELHPVPVPPLLILPLVENALKYGRVTSAGPLQVEIAIAARPDGGVDLEVANTGEWLGAGTATTLPSHGIGLHNLAERLRRYFPQRHTLATESRAGWVRVRIALLPESPGPGPG